MSTTDPPPTTTAILVDTSTIPLKPPDHCSEMEIEKTTKTSFKNVLLNKQKEINRLYSIYDDQPFDFPDAEKDTITFS